MTTPAYQGTNQPLADVGGSWFGRLGSFFGGGGTPAYVPAPIVTPPKDSTKDTTGSIAVQMPMCCPIDPTMCPIDPAALAAGQIAIVIPRERLGPSMELAIAETEQQ